MDQTDGPIEVDTPLRELHWFWHPHEPISRDAMKTPITTVSAVLLLSTLIWVAVHWEFPEAPLKPRETILVVFLCTIATATGQYAWRRWQHRHRKESRAAHK